MGDDGLTTAHLSNEIVAGAVYPEQVQITINSSDPTIDLTTVTGVSFLVTPGGLTETEPEGQVTWSGNIVSQTKCVLVCTHILSPAPSEVPTPDDLSILPILAMSGGGFRRPRPTLLKVIPVTFDPDNP